MRAILLGIIVLLLCVAIAKAETVTSSGTSYDTGSAWVDQLANDHLNHQHQVEVPERDNPVGVGVDAVVWENQKETVGVEVQGRYDTQNEETAVYVVGKVNLWKMRKQ